MTKGEQKALEQLKRDGFARHAQFPYGGRNRPYWSLVERGEAVFDFGPKGSWLKTQGFMLPELETK